MMKGKKPLMFVMLALLAVSLMYAWQGVSMHNRVDGEEAKFHALQREYWSLDKATRDAAPAGSELNAKLVEIKNYPSELLRLKLVGVGKILTGIFLALIAILFALMSMPRRLGNLIKG